MSKLDLTKLKHMDVVDMPSDPNGYLGNFRATLRGAYNSNRNNESAINLIKATLEYAVAVLQTAEVAPVSDATPMLEAPVVVEKPTSKAKAKANNSKRAAKR